MKKKSFYASICLLSAFAIWTVLVCTVGVRAIGPLGSSVGFASLNGYVHSITGVNMMLYTVTDWLGLVPIAVCLCFAVLGLIQWIKRKKLLSVDRSILVMGVFYVAVIAAYILFEHAVINYRPVLIDGRLEASYPSSTTMLSLSVMPTALMYLNSSIKRKALKAILAASIIAFTAFMVAGRLISGVHWITDIIGGALLSAGLVMAYHAFREK